MRANVHVLSELGQATVSPHAVQSWEAIDGRGFAPGLNDPKGGNHHESESGDPANLLGNSQIQELVRFSRSRKSCNSPSLKRMEAERRGDGGENQSEKSRKPLRGSLLVRWLKFNFVGGIGIAVQFCALFVLKSVFHFDYLVATALAVETAVVHNFVWHEQFTWADRLKSGAGWQSARRFVRFNLTTGMVSILGNLALMKVMVGAGHMNYLVANGIAIALCSLANFVVSDGWVFVRG